MKQDVLIITKALDFAARKHVDQRRKGIAAEPYINHLTEVGYLLAQATEGTDANLIAAGLLHDTIEDQGVTHAELVDAFNQDVADLVMEVTDDKSLEKAERKRQQVLHAPHKSARARMLKMADKTSNLRALVSSPPKDWDAKRINDYFDWAEQVVEGCRGVNAYLEKTFAEACQRRP